VGTFGVFLAESFREIVSVEQDPHAIEFARRNLPGAGREFFAMSCEGWTKTPAAAANFDAAVLDPPRSGLSPELRAWLIRKRIPRLRYVSCDPATLARDLGAFVAAGYKLASVAMFDFFPQTSHIETLAELEA
jgi:23S rRNA (uracil1939-C5)-methyltransferase